MKVFKSENEVVQMRLLGQAAARAFTDSMRQNFTMEKDLTSFLEYKFKANGCDTSAFVPVVAGGSVSGLLLFDVWMWTNKNRMPSASITRGTMMS